MANCLPPLCGAVKSEAPELIKSLLNKVRVWLQNYYYYILVSVEKKVICFVKVFFLNFQRDPSKTSCFCLSSLIVHPLLNPLFSFGVVLEYRLLLPIQLHLTHVFFLVEISFWKDREREMFCVWKSLFKNQTIWFLIPWYESTSLYLMLCSSNKQINHIFVVRLLWIYFHPANDAACNSLALY